MKKVKVNWQDSCSPVGKWFDADKYDPRPSKITSYGFLVHNEKTFISIAQSDSDTGHVDNIINIPKGCITKMVYLK